MKLSHVFRNLFEMPEYIDRELPEPDQKVQIMSVDTLDREYKLLTHRKDGGQTIVTAIKNNRQSAIAGYMVDRDDGKPSLRIVVNMSFHECPDLGEIGGNALQVDTVQASDEWKGAGYGYELYKALMGAGFTVASDNVQYIGGKQIWIKIVKRGAKDNHNVFILKNGKLMRDGQGQVIKYDGSNIPDNEIWGRPGSLDHHMTLLVAKAI